MTVEAIAAICGAAGVDAQERQLVALDGYVELLQRWNATYNLTAIRDPAAILVQHIADCVAIIRSVRRAFAGGRILDVGSGGGLPGVVLAILLPDAEVACLDSVGKKSAFVRHVAGQLGLSNLQAVHARIEQFIGGPFDLIVSRAFASLVDYVLPTRRLLAPDGVWVAMKGRRPDGEIAALPASIEVFHVEQLTVPGLPAERCLVWMRRRADVA